MKKLITIIVMAAVLLTACTIENSPVVDQIITINAIIAGDTKVALGIEDEKKVSWTEDDIINLTVSYAIRPRRFSFPSLQNKHFMLWVQIVRK